MGYRGLGYCGCSLLKTGGVLCGRSRLGCRGQRRFFFFFFKKMSFCVILK